MIERRPTVELVVSEENDYGIGNGEHEHLPPRFVVAEGLTDLIFHFRSILEVGGVWIANPL